MFGCGNSPIRRILTKNGIEITDRNAVKFSDTDITRIISAYDNGIGVSGIAKHLGIDCSTPPIMRIIQSVRGTPRNRSEQQFARMARSTPEQIAYLTSAAHSASRGRIASDESVRKTAKGKEGKIHSRSKWEAFVLNLLNESGLDFVISKAVNRYNIDFAVGSVAVEVFGGGWSTSNRARIDRYITRTKDLANLGYDVLFVVLESLDDVITTEQLVSEINLTNSLPTEGSQYRVVWGSRNGSSGFCSDINHDSFVRPFVNIRDRATGRYISVPR
jgi:very-short-patch-repair endonuclease